MAKYIWGRILRSIFSILAVLCIVVVLIYTLIPRNKMFEEDQAFQKLKGNQRISYQYNIWEQLDYLDFVTTKELCTNSSDPNACALGGADFDTLVKGYLDRGYEKVSVGSSDLYLARDYKWYEVIYRTLRKLVSIDTPNYVQDESNPNIERKYYVESGPNGLPALKCSGCQYQYQLYINGKFPFIHQNIIKLSFGRSYPTYTGLETFAVISQGQGKVKASEITFPTGKQASSAINLYSCRYKESSTLDIMDKTNYGSNYAACQSYYQDLSMAGYSYLFGIISMILAYCISIPSGIIMSRKKGQWPDKLGMSYINLMISVPSLAFIYFMKLIGMNLGLPDKFPQFGAGDIRSYILPLVILSLMSTSGTMIWLRRYMIDQANSDYVKFARAKGLSEKEIFQKHILRNAIIPFVNGIPARIVLSISGSVMAESVFAIPGMGKMLPDSIKVFNNNMIITLTFIFTSLSVFSLMLGDLAMTLVDPRIQLGEKGSD